RIGRRWCAIAWILAGDEARKSDPAFLRVPGGCPSPALLLTNASAQGCEVPASFATEPSGLPDAPAPSPWPREYLLAWIESPASEIRGASVRAPAQPP